MAEPDEAATLLRMTPLEHGDPEVVAAIADRDGWVEAIARLIQCQREAEGQPLLAEPLLAALLFHCADVVTSANIPVQDVMDLFSTILTQVAADRLASPTTFVVMPTSSRKH
jgi:hypothetical protein